MTTAPYSAEPANFQRADRLNAITVSEILQISQEAGELKRQGRDIIVLGAGEPDFDTPPHIKAAAARAMEAGETKYTALDGSPAMKAAAIEKFKRDNGLHFERDQISVSAGAKQCLFNAFMASLNPGDEVIIPTPYWVSYSDIVAICGGKPILVPCAAEDNFRLSAEALEAAITPKTKWLLLNSPSNPSGAAYSAADYAPLLAVLRKHPDVWLMVDDMYEHIVYDGFSFVTPAALAPDLASRTLTINGVSKAYAMTGWRIGFAAGPRSLIRSMAVVQSQSTSCPSSVSQAAAIEALTGPQDTVEAFRASFEKRRDLIVDRLNAIDGVTCRRPEGAFYAYPSCKGLLGHTTPDGSVIGSDKDFARYLLRGADVAVVPGTAFGLAPHFRISYATSEQALNTACQRIGDAISRLA